MIQPIPTLSQSPQVVRAINSEIQYQNSLVGVDQNDHGPEGQLVCMSTYLRQAEDAWNNGRGPDAKINVQHAFRKLATIAVRALIAYGAPLRPGFNGDSSADGITTDDSMRRAIGLSSPS